MSQQARQNLAAATDKDLKADSKRKMTQAIIDDENKKKDVYEFLEDDDDFEEFEIDGGAQEDAGDHMMVDSDLHGAEADKKLW